jgi:hypothetical protein
MDGAGIRERKRSNSRNSLGYFALQLIYYCGRSWHEDALAFKVAFHSSRVSKSRFELSPLRGANFKRRQLGAIQFASGPAIAAKKPLTESTSSASSHS